MASSSVVGNEVIVEVFYNGVFIPKPFLYYQPQSVTVRDVDFKSMGYTEFLALIQKVAETRSKDIYFCLPNVQLSKGITILHNDGDYNELLETAQNNGGLINVYVDHHNEPLFDWIDDQESEEYSEYEGESVEDDDDESILSDTEHCDVVPDGIKMRKNQTTGDKFLSKLCPRDEDSDSISDNEEGENAQVQPHYAVYDESQPWDKIEPMIGMQFSNPAELKLCMSNYAVAHGYDLWYEKNDANRLLVKCSKNNTEHKCPFRLWASWKTEEKTFQIKSLNSNHNCSRTFKLGSIVTYKWIGMKYKNVIMHKPKTSLRKMKAQISEKFNINVSVGQCRNARRFALKEIEGTLIEHYAKLWAYAEEIRRANPGSTVKMDVDIMPDHTAYFSKYYVCFKAVKDGWLEGCRKVICVDGCFLKGICRGELITSVGRDGNNHIYPIAWVVVSVENKETWAWFLDNLMDDIGGCTGGGLTLISDGHKGLLEAVKERMPHAEHRQCARHVLANFLKRFRGEQWRKLFWKVVYSTTMDKFRTAMGDIRVVDVQAYDYLMERDPATFSTAFFIEGRNCDAIENGVSESWNAAIKDARRKPIITMLEDIRIYVMERMNILRLKGLEWNLSICPAIRSILKDLNEIQRLWTVYPNGFQQFEVRLGEEAYAVDLERRICACRSWQLAGVPCVHAVAAISKLNQKAENFVESCFSVETYLTTYKNNICPLNGSSMWESRTYNEPLPPKSRRLPGRPKMKRVKAAVEREMSGNDREHVTRRKSVIKCSICQQPGHNKKTCPTTKASKSSDPGASHGGSNSVPTSSNTVPGASHGVPRSSNSVPRSSNVVPDASNESVINVVPISACVPRSSTVPAKRKKKSERLTKLALKRRVEGPGSTSDSPAIIA